MADTPVRFDDGAAYERMMGVWSRSAGDVFLDWLAPANGLRWVDVGCGNGAFTEVIAERCAPKEIQGVDPSEAQIAFARSRHKAAVAHFQQGDAMALPFTNASFDAAVMALVLFFVPDPPKGVAEMVRTVKPGGAVSAYAWDIPGGGFPLEPLWAELRAMNLKVPGPPHPEVSSAAEMRNLWTAAGLTGVETREIEVTREFRDFDEYWEVSRLSPSSGPTLAGLSKTDAEKLRNGTRGRLSIEGSGRIVHRARANAVKGRKAA